MNQTKCDLKEIVFLYVILHEIQMIFNEKHDIDLC